MNRTIAALTACLLGGCTVNSGVKTTPTFVPATLVNQIPQAVPYTGPKASRQVWATGVAAVSNANRSATVEPTTATMTGATWKIDDFDQNKVYRFPVALKRTTTILLPPGEQLNKPFGGNVDGFLIDGAYAGPRPAISISPRMAGARGNLQLATTGGFYSFEPVTRQTGINLVDVGRSDGSQPSSGGQLKGAPKMEGGFSWLNVSTPDGEPMPAWAPAEVWADAYKLAIRFSQPLPVMPALFAGQKGEQMVGYSTMVAGNSQYIVTNRRVTEAQLRLGEEVIDITARAPARESKAAGNEIDPDWTQAEALPEKAPGMPTINLVVMPGDGTMPAAVFTDKDLFDDVLPVDIDG